MLKPALVRARVSDVGAISDLTMQFALVDELFVFQMALEQACVAQSRTLGYFLLLLNSSIPLRVSNGLVQGRKAQSRDKTHLLCRPSAIPDPLLPALVTIELDCFRSRPSKKSDLVPSSCGSDLLASPQARRPRELRRVSHRARYASSQPGLHFKISLFVCIPAQHTSASRPAHP